MVGNLSVSPLEKRVSFSKQLSVTNRLVSVGTLGSLPLLNAGILSGLYLVQVLFRLSKSLCKLALLSLENAISLKLSTTSSSYNLSVFFSV